MLWLSFSRNFFYQSELEEVKQKYDRLEQERNEYKDSYIQLENRVCNITWRSPSWSRRIIKLLAQNACKYEHLQL